MRILTAPMFALGLGTSLRWASGLSWEGLLSGIVVLTVGVWVAAVAVTIWCVFAPRWERKATSESSSRVQAAS